MGDGALLWLFFGAFLLIAPHHFRTSRYRRAARPTRPAWGTLALISGGALLAVAVAAPGAPVSFAAHALVGLALFALAVSFAGWDALTGCFAYAILGLGTILAGLLPRRPGATLEGGDLFASCWA